MFRLGLISDIHADLDALHDALHILDEADEIICAGDLVDKGPDDDEVVACLRKKGIRSVKGNHDIYAVASYKYSHRGLEADTADFLEGLPHMLTRLLVGRHIAVTHASPWSPYAYIYSDSQTKILYDVVMKPQADLVILGHTHEPMIVSLGTAMIVNPGSLCGVHAAGSRTCAMVTLPEMEVTIYSLDTGEPVDIPVVEPRW